jgi:hypothetical protein
MSELEIERVQVYAVGPETTRYTWVWTWPSSS